MQVTSINSLYNQVTQNKNRMSFGAIKNINYKGFYPEQNKAHGDFIYKIIRNDALSEFAKKHDLDLSIEVKPRFNGLTSKLDLLNITFAEGGDKKSVGVVDLKDKFQAEVPCRVARNVEDSIEVVLKRLADTFEGNKNKLFDLYNEEFSKLPIRERLQAEGIGLYGCR